MNHREGEYHFQRYKQWEDKILVVDFKWHSDQIEAGALLPIYQVCRCGLVYGKQMCMDNTNHSWQITQADGK